MNEKASSAPNTALMDWLRLDLPIALERLQAVSPIEKGNPDQPVNFSQLLERIVARAERSSLTPQNQMFLMNGILRAVVESFGPYCTLATPPIHESRPKRPPYKGAPCGTGVLLTSKDGLIRIAHISEGPAKESGQISIGDIITRIDAERFDQTPGNLDIATEAIRGPKGSKVLIDLIDIRTGGAKSCALIRDTLRQRQQSRILHGKVGYISVTEVTEDSAKIVAELCRDMFSPDAAPVRGLILDLRKCRGGIVDAAIDLASIFLESGSVAFSFINGGVRMARQVTESDFKVLGVPLVTLMNRETASAAEIIAAALRHHKRSDLVGSKTFGKGRLQRTVSLGSDYHLSMDVGRWETAGGDNIEECRLIPDRVCADTPFILGEEINSPNHYLSAMELKLSRGDAIVNYSFEEAVLYAQQEFRETPFIYKVKRLTDRQWLLKDPAVAEAYRRLTQ